MRWLEAHRRRRPPAPGEPADEASLEGSLPIDAGDLRLRRVVPEDLDDLVEMLADEETMRFQLRGPLTAEQVAELIRGQATIDVGAALEPLVLAVELLPEAKVVGECMLVMPEPVARQASVGITLHRGYTGRGLASRALSAAVGFAFTTLGAHRVVAGSDAANERAHRLMERIGMRREGLHRQAAPSERGWIDTVTYAVLEDEWAERWRSGG